MNQQDQGVYLGHVKRKHLPGHMAAAHAYGKMSLANRRQVGSIIILPNGLTAQGYNGRAPGEPNQCEGADGLTLDGVIHAEINAFKKLDQAGASAEGSLQIITDCACPNCAEEIIRRKVKYVVYDRPYRVTDGLKAMLKAGVEVYHMPTPPTPYDKRWLIKMGLFSGSNTHFSDTREEIVV
jgi:dCMP deaminase